MKDNLFSISSCIEAPVEEVFKWHSRPGAIERLSPPWDPVKVVSRLGGINDNCPVVLNRIQVQIP